MIHEQGSLGRGIVVRLSFWLAGRSDPIQLALTHREGPAAASGVEPGTECPSREYSRLARATRELVREENI